jgi:hypothetical protein
MSTFGGSLGEFKRVSFMKYIRFSALLLSLLISAPAGAYFLACVTGFSDCVKTQGTEIPLKRVKLILTSCETLFETPAWRQIPFYTETEILKFYTQKRNSQVVLAWGMLQNLYDSYLEFPRHERLQDTNLYEVARSCDQLFRDAKSQVGQIWGTE